MAEERNIWRGWTTRRRALKGAAVGAAGMTGAWALACAQNQPSGTTNTTSEQQAGQQQAQAKRGGTLIFPSASSGIFAAGLDPHVVGNSESGHMSAFYQNLIRHRAENFEIEAELAQRWEQPSQTEYVFHLAPNVKWHNKPPVNGRAFTAEDVVYSLNRIGTNEARFLNKALVENIVRAEAVNQATVRVTTRVPDVSTLVNFADWSALMLAREAVERASKFATPEEVVGTGAFILRSMNEVSAVLERNPDYWKPGLPYMDGIRYAHSGDPQAGWAAFLSGQIDVQAVPGQETVKFAAEQGDKYTSGWFKDVAAHNLWQNTRTKPFDDARVRRALRLLIDHQDFLVSWVETWWGPGYPNILNSAFPHSSDAWEFTQQEFSQLLEWKQPKDDAVKEALSLLSAAGFTKDNPLKFELRNNTTPNQGRATAQVLQGQYNRLGQGVVQMDLNLTDNTTLSQNLARGEFAVAGPTARGSYFDPEQVLRNIYHSSGGRNFGKWSDPRADELIDRQRGIFDVAQRKVVVKDILRYFVDNAPYVTVGTRDQMSAFQKKVKGLAPVFFTGVFAFQFEQAWLDV